ncbi:MAG: cyclic nucleotide-binding domain-containing protein [Agathobacter sp.]|uniref:cyclic nucleotide-binding domain-containing protein n=1 Tax=Agathobacter sp. TaxID=2021311 RepID=UPI00257D8160|nr:cyclic nucleotide-binding domain-containing protein [Agathobacter sp.]MBQ1681779.1 cyclic nucleotide-binding domain-containing protein [Agathobacter sp.]
MKVLEFKKGQVIASRSDKVMEWYLVQKGTVLQKFELEDIELETNSIIGILEAEWFICDYVAKEDTTLIVIPCKDAADLEKLLRTHGNFRPLFLRAAIMQRHKAFSLYSKLSTKCYMMHSYTERFYTEYSEIAQENMIPERPFPKIENFEPIFMTHKAADWEIHFCNSLVGKYFSEYMQMMMKDEALTVGAIMEASAQMRRVTQGIEEMVNYLMFNKDIIYSEHEDGLFHLLYDLATTLHAESKPTDQIKDSLNRVIELMKKLGIFTKGQIGACEQANENYSQVKDKKEYFDVTRIDCVEHIMKYAGFETAQAQAYKKDLDDFREIPDKSSLEPEQFQIKKRITKTFYDIYEKAFMRSVKVNEELDPVMVMFFNFGFMDVDFLGEDKINSLVSLVERMSFFRSANVVTAYEWLCKIYRGEEEPSRSELDMDYNQYLVDEKKNGRITAEQLAELKTNQDEKVKFEIRNMFTSGHRITYGRVTSFLPVLSGEEMMSSVEKMAVTAEKIREATNEVRNIDYQAFFHDVQFVDPEHGINNETFKKEILPYVILMPTLGSKGMMWQETAGIRSATPGRFLLPIFSSMDLSEQMIELVARYRWEYCKHVMGVRWNDIREKSLTAEYSDYLQFYKKNHDLSQEAREKVKSQLTRAKNSYREVFVKDYVNWLKYESKGGFRLNKVARNILVTYCPFAADIRAELNLNPMYENAFRKLNAENLKNEQRLNMLYDRYEKAGGEITAEFKENLKYYQM